MSLETNINGKQASHIVRQYFVEQYGGTYGVILFKIETVEYDAEKEVWNVECSLFRTMFAQQKLNYSVVVTKDGSIDSVKKLEGSSR